jgi:hypothetical protein
VPVVFGLALPPRLVQSPLRRIDAGLFVPLPSPAVDTTRLILTCRSRGSGCSQQGAFAVCGASSSPRWFNACARDLVINDLDALGDDSPIAAIQVVGNGLASLDEIGWLHIDRLSPTNFLMS